MVCVIAKQFVYVAGRKIIRMTSPTLIPTSAPTLETALPSSLVLGMGVGTFTIVVLSVALAIVWLVSIGCDSPRKAAWRIFSTIIYGVIFMTLVFAPREPQYPSETVSTDNQVKKGSYIFSIIK